MKEYTFFINGRGTQVLKCRTSNKIRQFILIQYFLCAHAMGTDKKQHFEHFR